MKTVLFSRHAKSSFNQPGLSDFERVLNDQGLADSKAMSNYLKSCGYVIQKIISSDAKRALQTAKSHRELLTPDLEIDKSSELYLASHLDIIQLIKNMSSKCSTIMLVGHNPGMTEAVNALANEAIEDMSSCGVVIVQFEIEKWADLTNIKGDLLANCSPKNIV